MADLERLYVWEAFDERGGSGWYTIGAVFSAGVAYPLVLRKEELARQCEGLARAHGDTTGEKTRLAVYELVEAMP